MSQNLLIVIGSGPGIGVATASLFASKGFSVALISRNASRLRSDVLAVQKSAASSSTTKAYACDIGDSTALQSTLKTIEFELGPPEVVLFNAARIEPSTIGSEPIEKIRKDFEVMNIGLYVSATWAIPLLEGRAKGRSKGPYPTLLLSGGYVHEDPLPVAFALCMQKAMQHNLMKSLWKVESEKSVHVGVSNIGAEVSDEEPERSPGGIAKTYWELYNEERGSWRHSVDIGIDERRSQRGWQD
ncbi:MAG: hypothetical protein M1820_008414 [Bogoriella megaspora]|nr:MAG: hypothetical protein M1820_008414 [Bogoriella megaspora]